MERSSMLRAGQILLLVGAILSAVGVPFMLLMTALVTAVAGFPVWFLFLYGGFALLLALGAVFGFVAYGKAKAGDAQGAFVWGLVASLLPPLQVVLLIGAILCKVSPEGEAHRPAPTHAATDR